MLRAPSRRKRREPVKKLNLIPILDAVFIFIFFLLMSANFIKIFEIQSDVPIVSTGTPPKNQKPLALKAIISQKGISLYRGVPSRFFRSISKTSSGEFDYESLHLELIKLKKRNKKEREIILEPKGNISYEEIVKVMDAVRNLRRTDEAIYIREGQMDVRVKALFDKIVFGNIQG